MIALVDYGAGNLTSVRKALAALGASVWTPSVPGELARAHGIIVPGVGHFEATRKLTDDWRTAIKTTIDDGTPVLGICIGLQWLFEGSTEADKATGIGSFKGVCERLIAPKVPHVGWNSLVLTRPSKLMAGIDNGAQVYFTHSFAAPVTGDTVAVCEYGSRFSAAVERKNVSAVQFHPEKSGNAGLHILGNWLRDVK